MPTRTLMKSCAIVVCLSVSACDGKTDQPGNTTTSGGASAVIPSGTGPVAIDQLPDEMAIAVCNLLYRCAGSAAVEYGGSSAQCLSDYENSFADQTLSQLKAAIALGTSGYDPVAMRSCLDVYPQLNCDYSNSPSLLASCNGIWKGTVAIGGACTSNFECTGNPGTAYCASDGTCPGQCQALGLVGQPCANGDGCDAALECDSTTNTCMNRLKAGDLCGSSATATGVCGGFTKCVQDAASALFHCENPFDTANANEGAICTASNGCLGGLVCEATSEQSDAAVPAAVMRCQKMATASSPCRYAYGNPCPDGQYCPAAYSQASTSAQCTNQVAPGQSCVGTSVSECQGNANCEGNLCVAIQRIGGPCSNDGDCYSDVCTNSVCVAPKDCSR